jgi:DNA-binding response OmpR family regulator
MIAKTTTFTNLRLQTRVIAWHVRCPLFLVKDVRRFHPGGLRRDPAAEGANMRKRILLVEDDPHSRKGLQDSLLGDGHGVEAVSDGWQALRNIKEGVFDLAIVDLDLPSVQGVLVTGWDLARILRAYSPGIPILMVSAHEDRFTQRLVERFKISAFMLKPIDPVRFKAVVRNLDPAAPRLQVAEWSPC